MSYVRDTGLGRARQRRHRRSTIVVVLAAVLVVVGLVLAVSYITTRSNGASAATCQTSTQTLPQGSFVLNVYNASSDTGRAKRIALAMDSRGFDVGVVSNDPYGESLSGVGQVRFGPAGAAYAKKYVAQYMPGAQLMQDGRTGTSVDLVLGEQAPNITAVTQSPIAESTTCSSASVVG
ncbi:LytR C-terminal domain-containing protein [Rudaeicoccus suwonensis]|uniref:LytR cell envelope-related transcriptional attenuator n=1 Tax=Rudaeicoccus suwonensis TaxID=657409 RepID=A0A561E3B2_9MICO|nr:LytR C-terminal domain-containing protein [Rudaeicoccus suwonensis]TWE10089.1 LytR cell envelope-related transcriptional attenuator [Rudaeicoccus suwonensis]